MTEQEPQKPSDTHHMSLGKAFGFALEGIAFTVRTQRNMRIHLIIATCAVIACALLRLTPLEWAVILICIGLVLMTEMLNTAVEATIDLVSPEYHPLAKRAKDIGAGMVFMFASLSVIVGCIIFGSAILRLLG